MPAEGSRLAAARARRASSTPNRVSEHGAESAAASGLRRPRSPDASGRRPRSPEAPPGSAPPGNGQGPASTSHDKYSGLLSMDASAVPDAHAAAHSGRESARQSLSAMNAVRGFRADGGGDGARSKTPPRLPPKSARRSPADQAALDLQLEVEAEPEPEPAANAAIAAVARTPPSLPPKLRQAEPEPEPEPEPALEPEPDLTLETDLVASPIGGGGKKRVSFRAPLPSDMSDSSSARSAASPKHLGAELRADAASVAGDGTPSDTNAGSGGEDAQQPGESRLAQRSVSAPDSSSSTLSLLATSSIMSARRYAKTVCC
jgi:hypothetical protein